MLVAMVGVEGRSQVHEVICSSTEAQWGGGEKRVWSAARGFGGYHEAPLGDGRALSCQGLCWGHKWLRHCSTTLGEPSRAIQPMHLSTEIKICLQGIWGTRGPVEAHQLILWSKVKNCCLMGIVDHKFQVGLVFLGGWEGWRGKWKPGKRVWLTWKATGNL